MRNAFIETLTNVCRGNNNVILITGDLGFSFLEGFREEFGSRFINAGIAESNMIGMSAGLALEGKIPFVYSIVPFATMRGFEQIRNDVCYHNLNVKIVGVGGGFSYGYLGFTHHSLEDIAIMRSLPKMTIICPADPLEVSFAVRAAAEHRGPVYIRLGKSKGTTLHASSEHFKIGESVKLKDGKDITIVASGCVLETAMEAAAELERTGVSATVISMHTIKPLDETAIIKASKDTGAIFSLEEHSIIGGLGSAVAEVLAEKSSGVLFRRLGVCDEHPKTVGDQKYLCDKYCISPQKIVETIRNCIKNKIG